MTAREDERFLTDLLDSEHLGPAFKAVFETDETDVRAKVFLSSERDVTNHLSDFVGKKKVELKDFCESNYSEFLDRIDEMISMKLDILEVKEKTTLHHSHLQTHASEYASNSKEFLGLCQMKLNAFKAQKKIKECLEILQSCQMVLDLVERSEFYKALQIIEEIEKARSSRFIGFKFMDYFSQQLPSLNEKIRRGVINDFNNWLVKAREAGDLIGRMAIAQTAKAFRKNQQENNWELNVSSSPKRPSYMTTSSFSVFEGTSLMERLYLYVSPFEHLPNFEDRSVFEGAGLDNSAVFQSIYVHKALSLEHNFQEYFFENRKLQCDLVINNFPVHATNSKCKFLDSSQVKKIQDNLYQTFSMLTGFFVIEDKIYHLTSGFLSRSSLDEEWIGACQQLQTLTLKFITTHKTGPEVEKLLDVLWLFANTMHRFGYDSELVFEILSKTAEHYADVALSSTCNLFARILAEETLEPLRIDRDDDPSFRHDMMMSITTLLDAEDHQTLSTVGKSHFVSYPFSVIVPLSCLAINDFLTKVKDFFRFCRNPDEQIYVAAEQLLLKLRNCVTLTMQDSQIYSNLSQAIQLYVDHHYFRIVVRGVEKLIGSISYHTNTSIRLEQSRELWAESFSQSQKLLYKIIDKKMDEIMPSDYVQRMCQISSSSSSSIPKSLSSASRSIPSPSLPSSSVAASFSSETLTDLSIYIQGLETMVSSFNGDIQREIMKRAGENVAVRFLTILRKVPSFDRNLVTALQEALSLLQNSLERSSGAEGGQTEARKQLVESLRPVAEVLTLLTSPKPEEFLEDAVRQVKYHSILENMNEQELLDILLSFRPANPSTFSKLLSRLNRQPGK